ncbi:hypothetical protein BN131_2692 [Cronobacter malonaticus 681]|nr:hypothetical protein BN131_2692 [Cronobacter malonaticus 681]
MLLHKTQRDVVNISISATNFLSYSGFTLFQDAGMRAFSDQARNPAA